MRGSLTVPTLHTVAGAFVRSDEYSPFQQRLRMVFGGEAQAFPENLTYCIDHMPGSAALITFSTLAHPRVYTYKSKAVRIRPPDASPWSFFVQETELQKEPSSFVSDRKGYVQ